MTTDATWVERLVSVTQAPDTSERTEPDEVHLLLAELDPDQRNLIGLLGRPWMVNQLADAVGWPVWDFVRRRFAVNYPDAPPAADVLGSLPVITSPAFYRGSYGLWWRTQSPGLELQPGERVGLTIAGLEHLERCFRDDKIPRPRLVSVCLDILRMAAAKEEDLVADDDWTRPAAASLDLRSDRFRRDPSPPVEIVGQVLQHEYMPLARASTNFNYDVPLGPGGLARFKDVDTAADFLRVLDSMRTVSEQVDLPASPLGLPATLDYLGLLVAQHPAWTEARPLLNLTDFDAAASIVLPPPDRPTFDQRCSSLWNILGHLCVPEGSHADYAREGWNPETKGSINNLTIWLTNNLDPNEAGDCQLAITSLRAIGHVRQGSQHASASTSAKRTKAMTGLGIPVPVTNWPGAWNAILLRAAAAVYVIAGAVRRAPPSV